VFNATFSNISVISWRSVLMEKENGVPGENHRPVATVSVYRFIWWSVIWTIKRRSSGRDVESTWSKPRWSAIKLFYTIQGKYYLKLNIWRKIFWDALNWKSTYMCMTFCRQQHFTEFEIVWFLDPWKCKNTFWCL
jgi:hypothetical protein